MVEEINDGVANGRGPLTVGGFRFGRPAVPNKLSVARVDEVKRQGVVRIRVSLDSGTVLPLLIVGVVMILIVGTGDGIPRRRLASDMARDEKVCLVAGNLGEASARQFSSKHALNLVVLERVPLDCRSRFGLELLFGLFGKGIFPERVKINRWIIDRRRFFVRAAWLGLGGGRRRRRGGLGLCPGLGRHASGAKARSNRIGGVAA